MRNSLMVQVTAIDEVLAPLIQEQGPPVPRKRRNLKAERMQQFRVEQMLAGIKKEERAQLKQQPGKGK